tara:strand:- start:3556 stop:3981 length:426 start_codon:yes stop_codon:yes gene_type:complete
MTNESKLTKTGLLEVLRQERHNKERINRDRDALNAMVDRLKEELMKSQESAAKAGEQAYENAEYKEKYEDLREKQCLDHLEEQVEYYRIRDLKWCIAFEEKKAQAVEASAENVNLCQALQKATDQLRKTQTALLNVSLKLI